MRELPTSCREYCLPAQKVAHFLGAESDKVFRQLSANRVGRSGNAELLPVATFPRQATICCLDGCLLGGQTQ